MLKTFHSIVSADVILMGNSGFSWCAATLSDAKVYYIEKKSTYHYLRKKNSNNTSHERQNKKNNWFLKKWNKIREVYSSEEHLKKLFTNCCKKR